MALNYMTTLDCATFNAMQTTNFKEEAKAAYKRAVALNKLALGDLAFLHKRSEVAIEKYLYAEGRYPDFQCIYEIYWLIRNIGGFLPRDLARIINRSNARTWESSKKFNKTAAKYSLVGDVSLAKKKQTWLLDGEVLSAKQLALKFDVSTTHIRQRLKEQSLGSDITNIDFSLKKRGRPNGTKTNND